MRVDPRGAAIVNNRPMPDINMQHMCAVMLMDGTASFEAAHDEPRMRDKRTTELRERIELIGVEGYEIEFPGWQGTVDVLLKDGRTLHHHTATVRGTSENPMTREEVEAKAYSLIEPVLGKRRSRALIEAVWGLEDMKDVRDLARLLRA